MKKPLTIGVIAVITTILVTSPVDYSAIGEQPEANIDAHTNKGSYAYGEMVIVSGTIKNYDSDIHSNLEISFHVLDPSENIVTLGQAIPTSDGAFGFNFLAGGSSFKESGNYLIQLIFGSIKDEISIVYVSSKSFVPLDVTPPEILQPKDIVVEAETRDGITSVTFDVLVIDDIDKKILPVCKPSSGYLFGVGDTKVKCTAKDSAGNYATPIYFTVKVNPPETSIPDWVKNIAAFWCEDKIDDGSFVEGIQYLIENNIIVIPTTSADYTSSQEIPQWVKNNACWWSSGSITDGDFAYGIEYLVRQGIIRV